MGRQDTSVGELWSGFDVRWRCTATGGSEPGAPPLGERWLALSGVRWGWLEVHHCPPGRTRALPSA